MCWTDLFAFRFFTFLRRNFLCLNRVCHVSSVSIINCFTVTNYMHWMTHPIPCSKSVSLDADYRYFTIGPYHVTLRWTLANLYQNFSRRTRIDRSKFDVTATDSRQHYHRRYNDCCWKFSQQRHVCSNMFENVGLLSNTLNRYEFFVFQMNELIGLTCLILCGLVEGGLCPVATD